MYKYLVWPVCIVCLCLNAPLPAHAALKAKGEFTLTEAYNPHPQEADVLLPMPCGLNMALRVMAVPAKGFLWDMSTRLGRDDVQNADRAYYDSRFSAALSAPFALEDLPPAWRTGLPTSGHYYYLMGKYEVSGAQWRAVMEPSCPTPEQFSPIDAQPKVDISWYEAVDFSRKYTEWLLKNAPDALPRFTGDTRNVGFLRLPTEAEWEYAARGGQNSPSTWLAQEDFFEMPTSTSHADYAVFRPEGAARIEESPLRIGSRKPNPLGLYDTAGNAAEMVMDSFHFSLGGRLHGSAGGFVRKGGSYLSGLAQIMPGRREEVAFFQNTGPMHSRDLGFRLALSGINTPAGNRPATLQQEWQKAGSDYAQTLDTSRNPLEELDRLLKLAGTDAERKNLLHLRGILKDNFIALERQQALAAESLVRTSIYTIETVLNIAIRRKGIANQLELMETDQKQAKAKNIKTDFGPSIKRASNGIVTMTHALDETVNFYRSKVEEGRQLTPAILDAALAQVEKDSARQDDFNANLRKHLALYRKHLTTVRKGQKIDKDGVFKDIVPPNIR